VTLKGETRDPNSLKVQYIENYKNRTYLQNYLS